jgi:hypothetical protein
MASEITDHDQHASPSLHDDGNGTLGVGDARGTKRQRAAADDDDDDDDKPGRERRKIEIKFIQDKSRRHITFSKRKAGIMKKVRSHSFRARRTASASMAARALPSRRMRNTTAPRSLLTRHARHTSCPSSPAPRCCSSSCPRRAWCTHSPHPSCSRS